MNNNVITLKLSSSQEDQLFQTFYNNKAKAPAYARWQLRCENCVITCYESGKTVFQGKDAEVYASPFMQEPSVPLQAEITDTDTLPQAGSDEVGTGDYFGPVCVCATIVDDTTYPLIQKLGIRDSKQLTDEQIRKIGPELLQALPHSLLILDNASYNRVHENNNMNAIKAKLHNKAYLNLNRKCGLPRLITIDQFTPENTYYRYLKDEPQVIRGINFETKAEDRYPSVGAASVIARYAFLVKWDEMEKQYDMTFHKGGGAQADRSGTEFIRRYGRENLEKVAKLHFKNTERL